MKTLRPIGKFLAILAVAFLASCAKEDLVAPDHCQEEDVQAKWLMNEDGASRPGMPADIEIGKGETAATLRGGDGEEGGGGDGGGGGGGISDDGDEEADGERNKKDEH